MLPDRVIFCHPGPDVPVPVSTLPLLFTYNGKLIPWKWPTPSQRGVKKSVKWKAGQYISYLIRHPRRERETEREMGNAFFPLNELTEAASISSNVNLKWKLIVQYAATTLGYVSCISISGSVTKWVCSLGSTPRKADTTTNQPDFFQPALLCCWKPGPVCSMCVYWMCMIKDEV